MIQYALTWYPFQEYRIHNHRPATSSNSRSQRETAECTINAAESVASCIQTDRSKHSANQDSRRPEAAHLRQAGNRKQPNEINATRKTTQQPPTYIESQRAQRNHNSRLSLG